MELTDHDLKLARQGAVSAFRSARGLVSLSDLVAEANLWMIEHYDKVELWREQGGHGSNKLRRACRQRCLTIVARERRLKSKLEHGDLYYYTPATIRDILPDIFDVIDWVSGSAAPTSDEVKRQSRPSEGNNRIAMIADVRQAFYGLPLADRQLLEDLYGPTPLTFQVVAATLDVHERTVRRREDRAIEKMIERLGGEPPHYHV